MRYLNKEQILLLHDYLLQRFGGALGLRDEGLFESALYNPQQTFASQDLYPHIEDKAAALIYSIIQNHPFSDGNKRTTALALFVFLDINGFEINLSNRELVDLMVDIASGKIGQEQLASYIKSQLHKK